jgi:cell division septal protein FtsQ
MKIWPMGWQLYKETKLRRPGESLSLMARFSAQWTMFRSVILQWLSIALLIALLMVPLGLFGWLFFFTNMFDVQAVTVVDAREETANEVKKIINEEIASSTLGKNIFFVQADTIEELIQGRLAKVRTVHVVRKLPGTIKAIVQEKTPVLLLLSGGKYFFLDEQGVAYEMARLDTLPGIVLTTVKNDDEAAKVTIGAAAVDASLISFLQVADEKLPQLVGAQIGEVHVPSLAAREVKIILNNNWTVLFDVTRPAEGQIEVIRKLIQETVSPEEVAAMQHIDVRIPHRIYYKTALGESEGQ